MIQPRSVVGRVWQARSLGALLSPALLSLLLPFLASVSLAQSGEMADAAAEQRVIKAVHDLYGGTAEVRASLPLTEAFKAASRWELVVTKETDLHDEEIDPNPVTICFVRNELPACSERTLFGLKEAPGNGRLFHEFLEARVVYASTDHTAPLLLIKACSFAGLNGNCGVYTFLFAYDLRRDTFDLVFHDVVPRNNNGTTRFLESGPITGDVVSATPTSNAPYGYFVSVYRRQPTGRFAQILRYRSKTRYNDGNRLSVVDSEMPEIFLRLGLWRSGDPLPAPLVRPDNCTKLSLGNEEEWYQP